MGARYYNPEVGRWITRDSYKGELEEPQSKNKYIYAENNPVTYVDDTGNRRKRRRWPKKQTKVAKRWVYDGAPTGEGLWFLFKVIARVIKYKNGASKFHSNLWIKPPGYAITIASWKNAKSWVILRGAWYPMRRKFAKITSDNRAHAIFDKSFRKNKKARNRKTRYRLTTFGDVNYIYKNR